MRSNTARLQAEQDRKPLPATRAGCFIRSTDNDLGAGKFVVAHETTVEIEYFDSVGPDARFRRVVPREAVRRVRIPSQTRCWFEKDGVWQVGRVIELLDDDDRYSIYLPNEGLALLTESEFYIRWDRPMRDPVDALVANALDTPLYHGLRHRFISEMIGQRAACRGMTSLLSSAVRHYPHQIRVAAQVLLDDRQRYLLADEVGLGKTIEAGYVVRQRLIDTPDANVVLTVPRLLVRQWQRELDDKFLVREFETAAIRLLPHGDLGEALKFSRIDLLVVDEAHQLMPNAPGSTPDQYQALEGLARRSPGLLLLSATPLLHNEATFLAMLHLLDPDVYSLGDIEGFRRRVQERQELALRLNALGPGTADFLIRRHTHYLLQTFPQDEVLAAQVKALLAAIEDGRTHDRNQSIQSILTHTKETYRLHRRVLRNRRGAEGSEAFRVRGRAGVEFVVATEPVRMEVNDSLDGWRLQILEDQGVTSAAGGLVLTMLEASGSDLSVLHACLAHRLGHGSGDTQNLLSDEQRTVLSSIPVSERERQILMRVSNVLGRLAPEESRVGHVVEALGDIRASRRAIVFTFSRGLARRIATELSAMYGHDSVAQHLGDASLDESETEVERFRSALGCHFFVCDSSAEVGRNLQWADRIVHVDLPWSPNRVEQRLGRVDRYGDGSAVPSTVFLDGSPGSFADAWTTCLADGFRVFSDSIASLQQPVDAAMTTLAESVLADGIAALVAVTTTLPSELEAEREQISAIENLESASEEGEFSRGLFESVIAADRGWKHREKVAEAWISEQPGNLRFHRELDSGGLRHYLDCPPHKTPTTERLPLVPWDVMLRVFDPLLDRVGTYSRDAALRAPGTRIFAAGEAFMDALTNYSRWDTRGQAFGTWRHRREWAGEPEFVAFRADFVVAADIDRALEAASCKADSEAARAFRRVCDGFLPPMIQTIWVDDVGQLVTEEPFRLRLSWPFRLGSGDSHLSPSRRWALDGLIPRGWSETCRSVREGAERAAADALDLRSRASDAADIAEAAFGRVHQRSKLRSLTALDHPNLGDQFLANRDVTRALVEGIQKPRISADAIGCVVLAGYVPDGWNEI